MKIEVMYEVVRTLTIDVPKKVIEEKIFKLFGKKLTRLILSQTKKDKSSQFKIRLPKK